MNGERIPRFPYSGVANQT